MTAGPEMLPPPVSICGLPVHPLTMAQSVDAAEQLIKDKAPHQHVVVNASKVVQAHDDDDLAGVIRSCALVNADGQSVVWASRLLGTPLPERVAGIDFMEALLDRAAVRGYTVFLLGARKQVVDRVASWAASRGVHVVGVRDGYWTTEEEQDVVEAVRSTRPDMLFIGIPSPRKEHFLSRHLDALGAGLVVGVGGSFDVLAGLRRRAPKWMQRAGMEWFFRFIQEPRRMFARYLVGNLRFIVLVWRYRRLRKTRTNAAH